MSGKRGKRAGADAPPTRTCGWFLTGAFACLVAAGCIPAPGMDNAFYVLVPYAVAMVACGLAAAKLLGESLWRASRRKETSEEERLASVARRLFVGLAACIATCVGELFFLIISGLDVSFGLLGTTGGPAYVAGFVVLMLAAAFCFARARQAIAKEA